LRYGTTRTLWLLLLQLNVRLEEVDGNRKTLEKECIEKSSALSALRREAEELRQEVSVCCAAG
jgi:hypothetical protein